MAKLAVFFLSLIEKDMKKVHCVLALKVLHVRSHFFLCACRDFSHSVLLFHALFGVGFLFLMLADLFFMLLNLKYL